MADLTRILFVAGEVTPFTRASEVGSLVRALPEQLQEEGGFESRIMMPRYGTISERRNRLHEVIRLSGSQISVGSRTEELRVKVASIPGIRLQVYFMDNAHYFKRKGMHADKEGKVFADNGERALYFAKAALETTNNLGWKPDVVHAFGWAASLLPVLLKKQFAEHPLFEDVRVVYTPGSEDIGTVVSQKQLSGWGFSADTELAGRGLDQAGIAYADAVAVAGEPNGSVDHVYLNGSDEELRRQAAELYSQLISEGKVLA